MQNDKPPIGASPSWYVLPHRIKELADAISRNTEHPRIGNDKEVTKCIKQWATEIICQCETLDKLQDLNGGKE